MSATRLLVLAFVRAYGRAHGYLVGQELLAWNADEWANTKTGSIYHALRQLSKEGFLREFAISATETSPARTEYEISKEGVGEFERLLELALTVPDTRPDMLCAGLVLMSALPRATALQYLRARLATLSAQRADVDRVNSAAEWTGERALPPHVEALLDFWTNQTTCSHDWILGLIRKIEGGAYVFSDEDPKAFGNPGSEMARR